MRSKEEAILHPEIGDRWGLPINRVRVIDRVPPTGWVGWKETFKGRRRSPWSTPLSFRRWAANAEYLGGPE